MSELRIQEFPRTVPESHCSACQKRMRLTGSHSELGTIQLTYLCEACGVIAVRLMQLPRE